jgi:peptide/nickel transport system substrate-binding protein
MCLMALIGVLRMGDGRWRAAQDTPPSRAALGEAAGENATSENRVLDPLKPGNVLRFGMHVSEMGKMDPHFAAGSQSRVLADMVFNGLLRYEPGNAPTIEPDLAESMPEFTMAGGRQIWTFHLRKGVMFHPGPLTEGL